MGGKSRTLGALAVALLSVGPAVGASRDEREAAQTLVDQYAEAWNRHDRGAFSIVLEGDAAFADVLARWAHRPGGAAEAGTLRLETRVVGFRTVSPKVSAVEVEWALDGQRGRLIHTVTRGKNASEITATSERPSARVAQAE